MRILIDFDNTIANSAETIIKLYQNKMKQFSAIHSNKIEWNFAPYIKKEHLSFALSMFSEQIFYDNLDLTPNCKEVLQRLSKKHEIIIVTKKEVDAVSMNDQWIRNNLPFVKRVVYLRQNDFDKGLINGDIIIDDKPECLLGGDRNFRLMFGDYKYQQYDYLSEEVKAHRDFCKILKIRDWLQIERFIDSLNIYKS